MKNRILIIDDESTNLDFFDLMLSKFGFEISLAEDGEDGLERIKKFNPDLIILDNIMPRLSGWEVTKILKTSEDYKPWRDIPIIMFSAMDDVKDKVEGFELGIEDYITKPFSFLEVLARIRAVLKSRTLQTQLLQGEKKLTLIESLNKSLMYFTDHVRNPISDLMKGAKDLDIGNTASVKAFADKVITESEKTLATLDALRDEIEDLKKEGKKISENDVSLQELDSKFQKHFQSWKEKQEKKG